MEGPWDRMRSQTGNLDAMWMIYAFGHMAVERLTPGTVYLFPCQWSRSIESYHGTTVLVKSCAHLIRQKMSSQVNLQQNNDSGNIDIWQNRHDPRSGSVTQGHREKWAKSRCISFGEECIAQTLTYPLLGSHNDWTMGEGVTFGATRFFRIEVWTTRNYFVD